MASGRVLRQPVFQLLRSRQDHRAAAPARNGQHLRVVPGSDDDGLPPLLLSPGHDLMDTGNIGTGGVQDADAPGMQALVDSAALPMGADDDLAPLRDLLRPDHRPQAMAGQMVHHVLVVDDGTQHHTGLAGPGGPLRQLHRPAHAVAEAGRICDPYLHWGSPPSAWMRRMISRAIS